MPNAKTKAVSTGTWNSANTDGFRKGSEKTVKSATQSPKAAKAYLIKLGTHNKSGGLSSKYKG